MERLTIRDKHGQAGCYADKHADALNKFATYHNKKFEKWKAVFDKFYGKVVRYE